MRATAQFPATPGSVASARRFAASLLGDLASDVVDTVSLMVSELATNCVRHARTGYSVTVTLTTGRVRVEVTDGGGGRAQLRSPTPSDGHGRGLQIVSALADEWGVDPGGPGPGKTAWFVLSTVPRSARVGR